MRIKVKSPEMKHGIHLMIPNSLLGAKWVWRLVAKQTGGGEGEVSFSGLSMEDIQAIKTALRQYVRKNGHFNLVELDSTGGEEIRIRV